MPSLDDPSPLFNQTSLFSLLGIAAIGLTAYVAQGSLLPERTGKKERAAFVWFAFDGLVHLIYEGSWLYMSLLGTVNASSGPLAEMWKEYVKADTRWGTSDPTVVSLEILTVLGAGPLSFWILYQMVRDDPARHFWIVVVSTAELYGGWMTFCPEWLTGNQSLGTDNWLHFWVYLVFMNVLWVFIPAWLMWESYAAIVQAFKSSKPVAERRKGKQE